MFDFNLSFEILKQTQLLSFLFGSLILFSIFLFKYARVNFWIRFTGIPLVLALSVLGYSQLDNLLGYPYPGSPDRKVILMGFDLQENDNDQLEIVIWVKEKNSSRLYRTPWTNTKEQQIRKAMKQKMEGKSMLLDPSLLSDRNDFVFHEIEHNTYPEKIIEQQQQQQQIK